MRLATDWLEGRRVSRYRRMPDAKLRTRNDAACFVRENGLVTLFACKGIDLPSLFDATYDTESFLETWWGWKDALCEAREAFYGRLIQKKALLSSWDLFECFFALSGRSGEPDEYLYDYKQGRLGVTAKNICEHLQANGPTATDDLRAATRMCDKHMKGPFDRAMLDLQTGFLIAKVGTANRRWGVDVWDLLARWVPERVESALHLSGDTARQTILERYLSTTGVSGKRELCKALGWIQGDFDSAVAYLRGAGRLVDDIELGEDLVPALGHVGFLGDMGLEPRQPRAGVEAT